MSIKSKVIKGVCVGAVAVSGYVFSQRSLDNLIETHPDMQKVAHCALKHTTVDFVVVDGLRTMKEHLINVANGRSWIKRSKHIDGLAIDVAAYVNGAITYESQYYYPIADAFYKCANDMQIDITWGGEWRVKDLMHFEINNATPIDEGIK